MKIVFAGTPDFSAIHLKSLLESEHQVVAAYTQPDRPAGRGKKLSPSPVKKLALEAQIPVEQPLSFKDETALQTLRRYGAEVMVVVAYGLLLPKTVLETPRFGCINVHASILPRWRGAAPIQRAIEAGETESGVTIMQMDEGLDTGDMLHKVFCPIRATDSASELHDRLAEIGPTALLSCLQDIALQKIKPEKQDDALSTYAKKLLKQEGLIDWQLSAMEINNKIRAFNPFPMCYSVLDDERIRLLEAEVVELTATSRPGEIVSADKSGLLVATACGGLSICKLQLPGKKSMPFSDVFNGFSHLFAPGKCFT